LLHPVSTKIELVRVGGDLDGSYLVPLININYDGVISPGVGQTFEFEKAIEIKDEDNGFKVFNINLDGVSYYPVGYDKRKKK
jgi:hypothetical protein